MSGRCGLSAGQGVPKGAARSLVERPRWGSGREHWDEAIDQKGSPSIFRIRAIDPGTDRSILRNRSIDDAVEIAIKGKKVSMQRGEVDEWRGHRRGGLRRVMRGNERLSIAREARET